VGLLLSLLAGINQYSGAVNSARRIPSTENATARPERGGFLTLQKLDR
jgi:hypothetical protein